MKYVYKLAILALVLLGQNNVFASDNKTIKFHKPETEAEIALDYILRVENGLEKNSKIKHKDMFTKEFNEDYDRQICKDALSYEECTKDWDYDSYPWSINAISCSQDSPYGYAKDPYNELFIFTNCKLQKEKCIIHMRSGTYYMKKENEKWRIDGICCGTCMVVINANR